MTIYDDKLQGEGLDFSTNCCKTLRMCHDDKLTICYDTKLTLYEFPECPTMIHGRAWGWNSQQTAMKVDYLLWYKVDYLEHLQ